MRAYVLILLFGIICYCGGQTTSTIETSTDLPTIISETEIDRNIATGYCTFEIK